MTPDLSKLREFLENIGPLPIDPDWMYTVIRHGQRNMDIDVTDGFNEPERQSGYPMGELINALPNLLAELTAAREALEPFARIADAGKHGGSFVIAKAIYEDMTDGGSAPRQSHWHWTDFERARAALRSGEKEA